MYDPALYHQFARVDQLSESFATPFRTRPPRLRHSRQQRRERNLVFGVIEDLASIENEMAYRPTTCAQRPC